MLWNLNKYDNGEYECFLSNGERDTVSLKVTESEPFKPKEKQMISQNSDKNLSTDMSLKKGAHIFTSKPIK